MFRRPLTAVLLLLIVVMAAAAAGLHWLVNGSGTRITLERQLTAWLGQPVRIERASATIFPRPGVSLRNVSIGDPAQVTLGEMVVSTGFRPLLSRRLENAEVIVSDSRIGMPLPFAVPMRPPGATSAPGAPEAVASRQPVTGLQLVSVRKIELRDVVLVSLGRELRLSADSSLDGSTLVISSLTAAADDVEMRIDGKVDLQPRIVAELDATSPLLDLDALLALASAFAGDGEAAAPSPESARLTVHVAAPRARAAAMDLVDFEAMVTAYGGELTIDPMAFGIFGGQYEGWLSAIRRESLDIRIGASVANVDVAQLAAFGGSPGAVTGRLAGTARVGSRGRDLAQVLASARGTGDVTIDRGTLSGLDLVRTVTAFLGRPGGSAPERGSGFDQITATFAVADGLVTTEDLSLNAPDVDVLARGSLDLGTKRLDGRASLLLSDALSAEANQTVARYVTSGNRIVLPATIGGTLGEPRVGIDAADVVRRGLENEVQRRVRDFLERVGPF